MTVAIAGVDGGGHLILLHHLDDPQVASVNVAIGKARLAAIYRRPSWEFEEHIRADRIAALALVAAAGRRPHPAGWAVGDGRER